MAIEKLDDVLLKLDTRHRFHDYLVSIGAPDEAAALISSSEQVRKVSWNGAVLTWADTGRPCVDEPAAKQYFTDGPFKGLFPTKTPIRRTSRSSVRLMWNSCKPEIKQPRRASICNLAATKTKPAHWRNSRC